MKNKNARVVIPIMAATDPNMESLSFIDINIISNLIYLYLDLNSPQFQNFNDNAVLKTAFRD